MIKVHKNKLAGNLFNVCIYGSNTISTFESAVKIRAAAWEN